MAPRARGRNPARRMSRGRVDRPMAPSAIVIMPSAIADRAWCQLVGTRPNVLRATATRNHPMNTGTTWRILLGASGPFAVVRGRPARARQADKAMAIGMIMSVRVSFTTTCLLYTSDAADEEDSVDLGG